VPYLLGFHPRDSVVLLGLKRGVVEVAARLDLPDAVPELLHRTAGSLRRGGVEDVVAAIYSEADPGVVGPLPFDDLVPDIAEAVTSEECDLVEVLLIGAGRWWSYLCEGADCCPRTGTALSTGTSAVVAEATYAGMVALPDRSDVENLLAPHADAERERLRPALDRQEELAVRAVLDGRRSTWQRSVKRAMFAAARAWSDGRVAPWLGDEDAARFAVALRDIEVRDAVWLAVDDRRLDGRPLWAELARRLPAPYDCAPLFLFGWVAWRRGDGTLAGIAAERAVQADPQHSAAELLLAAVTRGLDPRRTPRLRSPL
jgi:hypothetical protein